MPLMLQYLNVTVFIYSWFSINYDMVIVIFTIFFRFFFFHSTSEKNNHISILVYSGLLTSSQYVSLNEWMITLLFNTKHIFSEPWMTSSPRDFWSVRWQLALNQSFKELGYLPAKNLFAPIVS